jgi:hypothetical protein
MSDLEAFADAVNAGAPTPAVAPADLKRVLQFMQSLSAHLQPGEAGNAGVDLGLLAEQCSPGANVQAVWLRSAVLEMLFSHGVLGQWQPGNEVHDAVFRVAATIPLSGVELNPDTFIERLRREAE